MNREHNPHMRDTAPAVQPHDLTKLSVRNIPEYRIDMSAERCVHGECALLIAGLKAANLYQEDYGYSVIHPKLLEVARTTGTYRVEKDGTPKNSVYCLKAGPDADGEESLVDSQAERKWSDYISFGSDPAREGIPILVYDMSKLAPHPKNGGDCFTFRCERKQDALIGIIILENY